jgi:hypothetical protein
MCDMFLQFDIMLMGIFRRGCGALQVRRICLLQQWVAIHGVLATQRTPRYLVNQLAETCCCLLSKSEGLQNCLALSSNRQAQGCDVGNPDQASLRQTRMTMLNWV